MAVADFEMLYSFGSALIILGILVLIAVAILIVIARSKNENEQTRTAGVIIIGPVPIIFGSKQDAKTLLKLSIILTSLFIAALLIYYSLFG